MNDQVIPAGAPVSLVSERAHNCAWYAVLFQSVNCIYQWNEPLRHASRASPSRGVPRRTGESELSGHQCCPPALPRPRLVRNLFLRGHPFTGVLLILALDLFNERAPTQSPMPDMPGNPQKRKLDDLVAMPLGQVQDDPSYDVESSFGALATRMRELTEGRRKTPSEVLQREGRDEK